MALEDHEYWSMSHNPEANAIELDWKSNTSTMSEDDFKLALEHLAKHIGEQSATGTLVDVRTFGFTMTPQLGGWRDENIIPAYNTAGLKRFAYVLPQGMPYQPSGGGDDALFITDYFEDPEAARAWLKDA